MEFINAAMLWGGLLIAAPIVIHILNRQKYQRLEWAAMRFLREAIRKMRKRLRLEELLLLMLRCLLLLLLALAISRPLLSGSLLGVRLEQDNFHAIVAVDTSASMGYKTGNVTAVDRARECAAGIIGALNKGDKLSILLLSEHPTSLIGDPTVQFDEAKKELSEIKATSFAGDMSKSLKFLLETIEKDNSRLPKRIFLITDGQQYDWNRLGKETEQLFRDLCGKAKVNIVDVGEERLSNCTVERLETSFPVVAKGIPLQFRADVVNNGESDLADVGVSLFIEGNKQLTIPVKLEAKSRKTVSFPYVFQKTGPHKVWVELDADLLMADNVRFLAVDVRDRIDILCVDGDPGRRAKEAETFFLKFALNPLYKDEKSGLTPLRASVITADDLPSADIFQFNSVILANVRTVSDEVAKKLEKYVAEGGGLIVFLGDRVDPGSYNRLLHVEGKGLLPLALQGIEGDSAHKKYVWLKPEDEEHPVIRYFRENNRSMNDLLVYQYYLVKRDVKAVNVKVLASYNPVEHAPPAIVEKSFGRGKTFMVTTTADLAWNEFAVRAEDFVPLMQELVRYVCAGSFEAMTGPVGGSCTRLIPKKDAIREIYIRLPSGESVLHPVMQDEAGRYRATFADTAMAGFYAFEQSPTVGGEEPKVMGLHAANLNPEEGSVARLKKEEFVERHKDVKFDYTSGVLNDAGAREKTGGRELWKYLLIAALAVACLETFLAMRFGRYKA